MKDILDDLENKLNIKITNIENHKEGTSSSLVFGVNKKYLIKTMNVSELNNQQIFLNVYKNINYFQKIILVNKNLNYICFKYINGIKLKEYRFKLNMIDEIYKIVKSYKKYDCDFYGYFDYRYSSAYLFLKSEIEYASEKIKDIDTKIVYESLNKLKKYKIEKYLLHGDFGLHNMLLVNNKIKVIDAMPLVFSPIYDFYFACLSSTICFNNLNLLFNYFDYDMEYKKNLFIIVFYIRMSRAYVYDKNKFESYLEIYNKLEGILKDGN
ncbi:MAG: hypothetical protein IJ068_02185 [Bacilli bacterium]|nr:hypothetical protein [Bacilli bacterium]